MFTQWVPDFLDEPEFWVHFNGWLTIAWGIQFPLVYLWKQNLQSSIPYLIGISIAAAALGQLAAWQAAHAELRIKRMEGGDKK